jgi:hypothetical protein
MRKTFGMPALCVLATLASATALHAQGFIEILDVQAESKPGVGPNGLIEMFGAQVLFRLPADEKLKTVPVYDPLTADLELVFIGGEEENGLLRPDLIFTIPPGALQQLKKGIYQTPTNDPTQILVTADFGQPGNLVKLNQELVTLEATVASVKAPGTYAAFIEWVQAVQPPTGVPPYTLPAISASEVLLKVGIVSPSMLVGSAVPISVKAVYGPGK